MRTIGLLMVVVVAASCGGSEAAPQTSSTKLVPHEKLLELLPTLQGWTRETPQGDTDPSEGVSRVQVSYQQQGGIGRLSIELMDTTGNAGMLAPLREFIKANRTEKLGDPTAPVTVAPITVSGFPGRQEWQPHEGANNGSLEVLVADRFTLGINGNSLSSVDVLKTTAEAIDLKKLAALK